MPDWFPKPPRRPGDVLYSESWVDYFLLSSDGNRIIIVLCIVAIAAMAIFLLVKKKEN